MHFGVISKQQCRSGLICINFTLNLLSYANFACFCSLIVIE